jgi:hypothetical protein
VERCLACEAVVNKGRSVAPPISVGALCLEFRGVTHAKGVGETCSTGGDPSASQATQRSTVAPPSSLPFSSRILPPTPTA